ncbi:dienelactone hydrolase family protein [Chryseobacterium koreense]|uniref:dienelactone hydrolase family protein n=1 Tax=Chryseobacterium koreense TaxID=232216 RepID=UPI0026F1F058|nr:dienelactone hydrolase family protein [Chryseobacterium koreense]
MAMVDHEINISAKGTNLKGNVNVPAGAKAMVIFSHGSGSSRFSPRNTYVANVLNEAKIATLLVDLLTPGEDLLYENRFDIDLLTLRLMEVTAIVHQQKPFRNLKIGYFGASTGAASAINAAVRLGSLIGALVSRGGRPDLADVDFHQVKAPTLLIVGSLDFAVFELNENVYRDLRCEKKLSVIEGATHLFEEEGKLEEVAKLASEWFQRFLCHEDAP